MKILELISNRDNKLSPYKLCFVAGAFCMIFAMTKISIETGKLAEVPQTWIYFLGVLGGSQLTSSFLKNKEKLQLHKRVS